MSQTVRIIMMGRSLITVGTAALRERPEREP